MERDRLKEGIEAALSERTGGPVEVSALERLIGGACQDNWRVELAVGGAARRMVLRSDAQRSLPGSLGRRDEFTVIEAAVAAGVRTPAVHWLIDGLIRPGAWAYFMDWCDGEAIGRRVLRNPELAAARAGLPAELARQLVAIHSITPARAPGIALPVPADAVDATLAAQRAMLDQLPEPHPAIELALVWLAEHRPAAAELVLCHGDFRVGNFLVRPDGLAGVLDWEFAHWGHPMDDLGWLCVRDWRFGRLERPVGGLGGRADLYRAYQQAGGRAVDAAEVHYWEIMGNVRWALGALYQGERYLSGAEQDLELIAIARRADEMEWEALRLIERGPWATPSPAGS